VRGARTDHTNGNRQYYGGKQIACSSWKNCLVVFLTTEPWKNQGCRLRIQPNNSTKLAIENVQSTYRYNKIHIIDDFYH